MFGSSVSRIRLTISVLGGAILGVSLFNWVQTLRATENGYAWVAADASSAPAVEAAEIWQVAASCVRPYLVRAALQSKAKLNAYYALAPEQLRARLNRRAYGDGVQPARDQNDLHGLVGNGEDRRRPIAAELERGAKLHAEYAEWYSTVFNLELQENRWERRLNDVADQRVVLGEATRRNFRADARRDAESKSATGDFEDYVLVLLGLGGFPSDQEQALKADCIHITPVKRIFRTTNYFREIWRWPVDYIAAFSFGLELVLGGMLFAPIALWIVTGDAQAVKRHLRDTANRLVTKVRTLHRSKFARDAVRVTRAILARTRALLTARVNPGPPGGEVRFADLH